jgi:hypothetical protein
MDVWTDTTNTPIVQLIAPAPEKAATIVASVPTKAPITSMRVTV